MCGATGQPSAVRPAPLLSSIPETTPLAYKPLQKEVQTTQHTRTHTDCRWHIETKVLPSYISHTHGPQGGRVSQRLGPPALQPARSAANCSSVGLFQEQCSSPPPRGGFVYSFPRGQLAQSSPSISQEAALLSVPPRMPCASPLRPHSTFPLGPRTKAASATACCQHWLPTSGSSVGEGFSAFPGTDTGL